MGRKVKRVPYDFGHPVGEIWPGYLADEEFDPPTGDGWQMWETTSEGSPMSPVFDTPEKLATWLSETGASAFGRQTATYAEWLSMILAGWAPSAVIDRGHLMSGVQASMRRKGEI